MCKKLVFLMFILFLMPLAFGQEAADFDVNFTLNYVLNTDEALPTDSLDNVDWKVKQGTAFLSGAPNCLREGCLNITGNGASPDTTRGFSAGYNRTADTFFTYVIWINYDSTNNGNAQPNNIWTHRDSGGAADNSLSLSQTAPDDLCTGKLTLFLSTLGDGNWDLASNVCGSFDNWNLDSNYMISIVYNETGYSVWINKTRDIEVFNNATIFRPAGGYGFHFGDTSPGASANAYFRGWIDEVMVWNRDLNRQEIEFLYDNELLPTDGVFAAAAGSSIDLVIEAPANDTLTNQNNVSLQLNVTSTSLNTTCEMSNSSDFFAVASSTVDTKFNITLNTSGTVDTTYNLNITCFSNEAVNISDTEFFTVVIDQIDPFDDLLTVIPADTQLINNRNFTITASNTNLFGHNVTVYDASGNIIFSNETLNISAPTHSIILPIDINVYGAGIFTVFSNESDDHTKRMIKDYNINPSVADKKINFDTGSDDITITMVSASKILDNQNEVSILNQLQSLASNKRTDRYNFEFNFNSKRVSVDHYEYTIDIKTSRKLYHRMDSEYQAHFVLDDDHWIDFEGNVYDVAVSQISDTYYRIRLSSSSQSLLFESIGGTNQGGSASQFEIITPSISEFTCEESVSFKDCTTLTETLVMTRTRVTCTNTTSALLSLTLNKTAVFTNETASKSGDDFTFNNPDETLLVGDYVLSGICINDAGNSSSSESWTIVQPADIVLRNTLATYPYNTYLSFFITVFLMMFLAAIIFKKSIEEFLRKK